MRPISKGTAPKTYLNYKESRDDLIRAIGTYCSYCEMVIKNMPAVEHVVPRANGGAELEWENFLLSCIYCNSNKSNNNLNREGYLWPDKHNTFIAFEYSYGQPILVKKGLSNEDKKKAQNTIDLLRLDMEPNSSQWKNRKDMRPMSRLETWQKARESLKDWEELPIDVVANAICRTATSSGHFSIWMEVFKEHRVIREKLIHGFIGTNKKYFEVI